MKIEFNTSPFVKLEPETSYQKLRMMALDYFIKELGHVHIDFSLGESGQTYSEGVRFNLRSFLTALKRCE